MEESVICLHTQYIFFNVYCICVACLVNMILNSIIGCVVSEVALRLFSFQPVSSLHSPNESF